MNSRIRKHIWPMSLVMSIAIIGALAAFLVLTSNPGVTGAHGGDQDPHCSTVPLEQIAHDVAAELAETTNADDSAHTCDNPGTDDVVDPGNGGNGGNGTGTPAAAMFDSSSTSASAGVELTFTSLPLTAADVAKIGRDGGSVELFLEDDFVVPDSISPGSIYFTLTKPTSSLTGDGGRIRAVYGVEVNDGNFFDGDDDWAIQVYLPDLYTASVDDAAGFQGPEAGQTLTMVVTKSAGITNPSEEGKHSVGYKFLGPTDDADKDGEMSLVTNVLDDAGMSTSELATFAKIGLSDEGNERGYEMTVTGTGFNNGTTASAHVLANARYEVAKWWETLDCAGMQAAMDSDSNKFCLHYDLNAANMGYSIATNRGHAEFLGLDTDMMKMYSDMVFAEHLCRIVIMDGTEAGSVLVGSDSDGKAAVIFEVTSPTFKPGNVNFICMKDGENRQSSTDVEMFDLEPSIRVVPGEVSSGDTVTVFAQDFPNTSAGFTGLKLAGVDRYSDSGASGTSISRDGSATATFTVPGDVRDTVRVDATWGDESEDSKIVISPSALSLSRDAALPNEDITITGNGFGGSANIAVSDITVDNVRLIVDDDSAEDGIVSVSNAGQFVATITLWPYDEDGTNPTLISGTHVIRVEDSKGFQGEATVTIAEPAITVTPEIAGPRDYITITGINWPVDNPENPLSDAISITVSDGARDRMYSAFADNAGRFVVEHRVNRSVAIPSTNQIKATYKGVVKVGSFATPASTIVVTPTQAQPGDTISISATDMPVYTAADEVKIGGTEFKDPGANTDIDGNITIDGLLVPGLDPGTYSVLLDVNGTIAIGSLEVLAEDSAAGAGAELPGALEGLDDNLVRVFHFNDVDKSWDFFDPRDEFAELNTLTTLVNGEPYWVLVSEGQEDVVLNNKARTLTCVGGDCWNQIVW